MNDTKEEAGYFKVYADILNHLFLFVLNLRSNVHTEGLNESRQIIDLEYMLRENCKLSRQLQTETKNSRTKKEDMKSAKLTASQFSIRHFAAEGAPHGLFPLVQVERTLRIIKHEKMYLDKTNSVILSNYLQKVALVLLETLNEKVELSRNQEKIHSTLCGWARHLERQCEKSGLPMNDKEDHLPISIDRRYHSSPPAIQFIETLHCEDIKVDFEQPISLVNPNYIPPSDQI